MALKPRQAVSVTTTATRLDQVAHDNTKGSRVLLVGQGSGTLVLGAEGVTAANGCRIPVVAGTTIAVDLDTGEKLYGIVASGTLSVDVLQGGA